MYCAMHVPHLIVLATCSLAVCLISLCSMQLMVGAIDPTFDEQD